VWKTVQAAYAHAASASGVTVQPALQRGESAAPRQASETAQIAEDGCAEPHAATAAPRKNKGAVIAPFGDASVKRSRPRAHSRRQRNVARSTGSLAGRLNREVSTARAGNNHTACAGRNRGEDGSRRVRRSGRRIQQDRLRCDGRAGALARSSARGRRRVRELWNSDRGQDAENYDDDDKFDESEAGLPRLIHFRPLWTLL